MVVYFIVCWSWIYSLLVLMNYLLVWISNIVGALLLIGCFVFACEIVWRVVIICFEVYGW